MTEKNSSAKILLHIGLPKTGTASLQRNLFDVHPEIVHFGQSNVFKEETAHDILKSLVISDAPERKSASKAIKEAAAGNKAIVISDEALSFGQYMLRGPRWNIVTNHTEVAGRSHDLLGGVDVLIVVRNQVDWVKSWHSQGLKTGRYIETNFQKWLEKDIGDDAEHFFDLLNLDQLYQAYADIFGEDHVHVYLYEDYRNSYSDLIREVAGLINLGKEEAVKIFEAGESRNVTPGFFMGTPRWIKKFASSSFGTQLKNALPKKVIKKIRAAFVSKIDYEEMTDDDKLYIFNKFKESNRTFVSKIGVDGSVHGYY